MAEPQLIVFISPDVNYALCLFFCGAHRILQVFVRKYIRRTRASRLRRSRCFWEARWWKQEARRTFPPSHNRSMPMHRLPILSPPQSYGSRGRIEPQNYWEWSLKEWLYFKQQRFASSAARILRPVPGAGNHYGLHISQSYQGMAVNITSGARGDRLGPEASQIGSQFPPADENKHFPHHCSKRGICKNRWQDTSAAQLWIFLWWMFNRRLVLRHEWIVHASKKGGGWEGCTRTAHIQRVAKKKKV